MSPPPSAVLESPVPVGVTTTPSLGVAAMPSLEKTATPSPGLTAAESLELTAAVLPSSLATAPALVEQALSFPKRSTAVTATV